MSAVHPAERDIGAAVVSPQLAVSECRLPAKINAALACSDGSHAVFALGDGTIFIASVETQPAAIRNPVAAEGYAHEGAATALGSVADGFVSAGQDGKVIHWSSSETVSLVSDFGSQWIDAMAVSPGKKMVASASRGRFRVSDLGGKVVAEQEGFPSSISGIAFSPDGRLVAASHLDGVTVMNVDSGEKEMQLAWKGSHIALTWSPDGRFVVTATQERELHVWDLVTMQDFRMGGYPNKVHGLAWSADGAHLFCSGADVITSWPFTGVGPAGRPPREIGYVFNSLVTGVAAHPTLAIAAGAYASGAILIGGVARGEALNARAGGDGEISALDWTADGRALIAGSQAGEAVLVCVPEILEL